MFSQSSLDIMLFIAKEISAGLTACMHSLSSACFVRMHELMVLMVYAYLAERSSSVERVLDLGLCYVLEQDALSTA